MKYQELFMSASQGESRGICIVSGAKSSEEHVPITLHFPWTTSPLVLFGRDFLNLHTIDEVVHWC